MLRMRDALQVIEQHRDGGVVVTTMTGSRGWNEVSSQQQIDLPMGGCMGKASSLGLGIALAQPARKTIVIDGDGSLVMNLGTLTTVANKAPSNLIHVLLENGVYGVTGGQPIPGEGVSSFAGMAQEAGYKATFDFDNLEDFAAQASEVFKAQGPVFVCLRVEPEIENLPVHLRPRAPRRTVDALREVAEAIAK